MATWRSLYSWHQWAVIGCRRDEHPHPATTNWMTGSVEENPRDYAGGRPPQTVRRGMDRRSTTTPTTERRRRRLSTGEGTDTWTPTRGPSRQGGGRGRGGGHRSARLPTVDAQAQGRRGHRRGSPRKGEGCISKSV
jgi:hypothetical protein